MSILQPPAFARTSLVPDLAAAIATAALCVLLTCTVARANTAIQPLVSIRQAAEKFILAELPKSAAASGTRAIVTAGYLDARLRLTACDGNLTASRPPGSALNARNTVAVACLQGTEWTVYVPVTVESETTVLVTRRAITRGATMTADDVEPQSHRVPGLTTLYIADPLELAGVHAKRALPAGTLLTADALAANLLIKRGQQVTLLAAVGGIEVRASGRALADGGAADRIRVQNLNSSRVVEGLVESADIVRISP